LALYDPIELTPFDRATTLHLLEPQQALEHFKKRCATSEQFEASGYGPEHLYYEPSLDHVHNLAKLAVHLRKLPADYPHFSMGVFNSVTDFRDGGSAEDLALHEHCGSTACAVGHGPLALGIARSHTEDWITYSRRVFGPLCTMAWDWCFSGDWEIQSKDSGTAANAAARIAAMLDPDFTISECLSKQYTEYTA
jgi:hypothetical protein